MHENHEKKTDPHPHSTPIHLGCLAPPTPRPRGAKLFLIKILLPNIHTLIFLTNTRWGEIFSAPASDWLDRRVSVHTTSPSSSSQCVVNQPPSVTGRLHWFCHWLCIDSFSVWAPQVQELSSKAVVGITNRNPSNMRQWQAFKVMKCSS